MTYTDRELAEIDQWLREAENDYYDCPGDVILDRFDFRSFVSNSKGRNRSRKQAVTIELFRYREERIRRWRSNPPFDVWATETYTIDRTQPDPIGLSETLKQDIKKRFRK